MFHLRTGLLALQHLGASRPVSKVWNVISLALVRLLQYVKPLGKGRRIAERGRYECHTSIKVKLPCHRTAESSIVLNS